MGGSESKICTAPDEILKEFKCNICDEYLTWFPLKLHPELGNICGRCISIEGGIRNNGLEAIVKLHNVPCRYKKNDCKTILSYKDGEEEIRKHELNCDYRKFYCPSIYLLLNCNWHGRRMDLKNHYKLCHDDLIFKKDKNLRFDLTAYMNQNIMVEELDKVFFLHIKYDRKSQIIYCGLISLHQPSATNKIYEFTIEFIAGTNSFTTKSCNSRMAENFLIDEKNLFKIDLNEIPLLIRNISFIEYNIKINEIDL